MSFERSKEWKLGYSWFCSGRHSSCLWGESDDVYDGWVSAEHDLLVKKAKAKVRALNTGGFSPDPVVLHPLLDRPLRVYGDHRG